MVTGAKSCDIVITANHLRKTSTITYTVDRNPKGYPNALLGNRAVYTDHTFLPQTSCSHKTSVFRPSLSKIKNIYAVHIHSYKLCKKHTYHSLHHQHPLLPQLGDKLVDIDALLCLYPLQHGVQCDEGASSPHASTTVDNQEVLPTVRMVLPYSLVKVDEGDGVGWHPVIRPA